MRKQVDIQQKRSRPQRHLSDEWSRRSGLPDIRRGALPKLTIHQITDDELESLSRTHEAPSFTWGSSLLSVALTVVITLLTTTVTQRVSMIFAVLAALCFGSGIVLVLISFRQRKSKLDLVAKIRNRQRLEE